MELLLFAHDHSLDVTLAVKQLADLPKLYDLVTWQADSWNWGKEELANAWFRIIAWPDALPTALDSLLSPALPSGGTPGPLGSISTPQFLGQYRGFFLDLRPTNTNVPVALQTWWNDTKRTQPIFPIPSNAPLTVVNSKVQRTAIANPAFIGAGLTVIGP